MIETRDLTVTYDGRAVLRAVDLTVPDGGHIALMGPSGCGKTTLLRVLAGLRAPDGGTVRVSPGDSGGRAVSSSASADFFFARPAFGGFASGGTSRQPFCSTTRPFVRNWCSPTPVMTFVASYSHAG